MKSCRVVNKHHHLQTPNDVYIGRGSIWGNPFKIGADGTREEVVSKYERYLRIRKDLLERLPELKGKNLVCFCAPLACHGDVLKKALEDQDEAK